MSVSYFLALADKKTNGLFDEYSLEGIIEKEYYNISTDFTGFANLVLCYPEKFLPFFKKQKGELDFMFTLEDNEISPSIYEPEKFKILITELLLSLEKPDGFPIPSFQYFKHEDVMECQQLYVNLKGSELNKIVIDKGFFPDIDYDVNTSFDYWNNYEDNGKEFCQKKTTVYVKSSDKGMTANILDMNSFPSTIKINNTQSNIDLGKIITEIQLINKSPYEHLSGILCQLIEFSKFCERHGFGFKSICSY